MGSLRRTLLRVGLGSLCAGAVAAGAGLAHYLDLKARVAPELGVFPPPMTAAAMEPLPELTRPIEEPPPPGPLAEGFRGGKVITGGAAHRLILFTFDDGPDPRNTPRLLDELDEVGIKAVFFLTASRIRGDGAWGQRNQELAREIVQRGHIVGNHTIDHVQLPLLDEAGVLAQVQGADAIFERVLGERTWLLRPPGGARSERVDALLASHGYTQVLWNLGTGDFQVRDSETVVDIWRRVLERRERENGERGGVVLLHDTHEWSVEAFPRIVSMLRQRNCELLADGEELYDIVDDPALFYVARGTDHPSAEAPLASAPARVLEERQRRLRVDTAQRCARLALAGR